MMRYLCVLVTFMTLTVGMTTKSKSGIRMFPNGFLFGAATAAYQIEGAWNKDGKAENIWDHLTHTNSHAIKDGSNGDIAADSYHLYRRDVEMVRELGLDYYRFSLSWTRIMPTSFPNKINEDGVQYYNNLINEMIKYNITPMVTLYHWDLPQKLQEMGGWTNPHIVDWFGDYARTAFSLFGDRVKNWITINEPYPICYMGYGNTHMAPLSNIQGYADYLCVKNLILAHARAYHIYDEVFRQTQGGEIGITFDVQNYEPATESEADIEAASDYHLFRWQIYANPIFSKTGDFPSRVKEIVAARSTEQGFPRSRLPEFTLEQIEYARGSADFFGVNHYSTYLTYRNKSVVGAHESPSMMDDLFAMTYSLDEWKFGESDFTKTVPWGFYNVLRKVAKEYNNPPVYITENGYATHGGLVDEDRIDYYRKYLSALLDAIEDGSDIRAYTAWSIIDNFEWLHGYTEQFGLYEVDYNDPARTRTPRKSAFVYKEIVRSRALDPNYEPDTTLMKIDEGH